MSHIDSESFIESVDCNATTTAIKQVKNYDEELQSLFESYQKATSVPRLLSNAEEKILNIIANCFKIWYEPWMNSFLMNGREFRVVYDLMEGLLHYEYQITNSNTILSTSKTNAIEQAVIRLVDYGNAILNIDLIIRTSDDSSNELDPYNVTTIELYNAHLRANNLRKKLLYDYYFKRDKSNSITSIGVETETLSSLILNNGLHVSTTSNLQVPSNQPMLPSPSSDKSRTPVGSSLSINTITSESGRKTPQSYSSPSQSQIQIRLSNPDTSMDPTDLGQIEITHMTATIRSSTFASPHNSVTRQTLLPGILSKIESLLSVPATAEKTIYCFELLDALLDSIEKLPAESRSKEVNMLLVSLMKPIVRKVYIDDRENFVELQHAHWTTCLLSMIRLTTASDFGNYLRQFSRADLGAFLRDYLFIIKRIMASNEQSGNLSSQQIDPDPMAKSSSTYPDYWIEMKLVACSAFFTSLTYLYQILRQCFASNLQTWMSFIDCLINFIMQETLRPGRVMLKERQRLLSEDLRQTAAEYIWITWDSLNPEQKQHSLEDIIEPLLRACMLMNSKQRSTLLPIFYDMMRCDYSSQYITSRESSDGSSAATIQGTRGNSQKDLNYQSNSCYVQDMTGRRTLPEIQDTLKTNESLPYLSCSTESEDGTVLTRFTHLIVGKLNTLMIDLNLGDDQFKQELCEAISGHLNPKYYNTNSISISSDSGQFKSMAQHTSDLIAEFMQICLDLRQANKSYYKHIYLLCLFKLILFFKDKVDRVELYLTNLYKLCYLHHTTGKFIEAGFTLLEHAKTIQWSEKPLESHHRIINKFFNAPEPLTDYSSLKVFLYNTIIEYFDRGQIWESAIPLCRELAEFYEHQTFEYEKVANIMQKMSGLFGKIVDISSRSNPEYFRITFYGSGFPNSIRESTMVYRGKPFEKLGDFQATMLEKYPGTKLLHTLARPDDSVIDEPGARYLQINACSPVIDLNAKFGASLPKIQESILNYYRHNECDKFNFSRRITRPKYDKDAAAIDNDNFANMWRERTTLMTNTLPGMLPFFPVYLVEISIVSPIESAVEDLERANDRLSCMLNRFKADKRQVEDVRLLGQLLLGIVDAAVNGGITKYEEAFFGANITSSQPQQSCNTKDIYQQVQVSSATMMEVSTTATTSSSSPNMNVTAAKQQSTCADNINHVIASLRLDATGYSNSGRDKYDQCAHVDERPTEVQVDKLKHLIAQQVPLLDEAIRLHSDRVADVMRPQHEHLEASYKKLKHHIMTNYYRYLPSEYKSRSHGTLRSYRSLARSPNRSMRSESRLPFTSSKSARYSSKRMSDAGCSKSTVEACPSFNLGAQNSEIYTQATASNIPYKQLGNEATNERRSLPFLAGVPSVDRDIIRCSSTKCSPSSLPSKTPLSSQVFAPYDGLKPAPIPAKRTNLIKHDLNQSKNATYIAVGGEYRTTASEAGSSNQLYTRLIGDEYGADNEKSDGEMENSETKSGTPLKDGLATQENDVKLVVL